MIETSVEVTSETPKVGFIGFIPYKIWQKVDFIDIKLFLNGYLAVPVNS